MARAGILVLLVALRVAAAATAVSAAYIEGSYRSGLNCTGEVQTVLYVQTGVCVPDGSGGYLIYGCNATIGNETRTSCQDSACTVGCTLLSSTPLGCNGPTSYRTSACVNSVPAAGSIPNTLWTFKYAGNSSAGACSSGATPFQTNYYVLGCNTSGGQKLGCNGTSEWHWDCADAACGNCSSVAVVTPTDTCRPEDADFNANRSVTSTCYASHGSGAGSVHTAAAGRALVWAAALALLVVFSAAF